MASRLARTAAGKMWLPVCFPRAIGRKPDVLVGAGRLRPTVSAARSLRAITAPITQSRAASNVPAEDPKKKAQSIIDSLPGNSLVSKAAILSTGAGLSIAAISNELYVLNEESIVALSLLTVFWAVAHYGGPMYKEWAQGQEAKMKGILNAARDDHTSAVKKRITDVKDLSGVIDITKTLFEVSKETAKIEAEAYELEQKTALAAEAKSVLDSWVRYEGQVKARQQKELAETVIGKIEKELENPKVLKQILDQSVADVERIVSAKS
ncbi:ATP synthase subunit 4 mitochondrial precursor [Lineolata rhizophorae]|uniref:ATP synthase subunit 4 n=1 Tax=Lineolata rhizophorae TaxID=578093 RepID=A0A6A6P8Y7_9PEZI|nr:ATP synthase subunit 4 mitochondrial precursor [Lineolata rhizophorae]